jgi:hypothetical protein
MKTNFSHNIQVVHSLTRLLLQTISMIFLAIILFAAIQGLSEVIIHTVNKETQELAAQPTSELTGETNLFLPANLEVDSRP